MKKQGILLFIFLSFTLYACKDAEKAVESLNKSAELLKEIGESGTWEYTANGVKALGEQEGGFASRIILIEGTTSDDGQTLTGTETTTTWIISTDAQGDSRAQVTRNETAHEFITVDDKTYRVAEDSYSCVAYMENDQYMVIGDESELFSTNAGEIFAGYNFITAGLQAFSVAEKQGSEAVNGINTTRYHLVSKLSEARTILKDFPSDELQQRLNGVPEFYVDGNLYIDDATKALIKYDAKYANLQDKKGNTFLFEVTELGNQADITAPDAAQITSPCEGGNPVATQQ